MRIGILLWLGLMLAAPMSADEPVAPRVGKSEDATLTGRDVYQCVVDNRFRSYIQEAKLISGDRGSAVQESSLRMTWSSFRDENDQPVDGVFSKSLVRYTEPFDLRHSGYLIVNRDEGVDQQWVYLNSRRQVRRVNLREEAVFGTDFTFEDIVPTEIEDADYQRQADKEVAGIKAYVVEVTPKPDQDSEYSKLLMHVDKARCVPLFTRYWDDKGLEIKQLNVKVDRIETINGVHWPMELTMRNLQLESFTTLVVEKLDPDPKLRRRDFDLRRLEGR